MKKQYGMMSIGAMVGIGFAAIIGLAVITGITGYYGGAKTGATSDKSLVASYQNLENILSGYSLKIADAVQIPAMYRDDFKDVASSVMKARQGPEGSKATFQWFKEHEINIDSAMYTKIQQMIEAGRDKYANAQQKYIDERRAYETVLEYDLFLTEGFWVKLAGYPKIDIASMAIISSEHAKTTFKTKVDTGLKLR